MIYFNLDNKLITPKKIISRGLIEIKEIFHLSPVETNIEKTVSLLNDSKVQEQIIPAYRINENYSVDIHIQTKNFTFPLLNNKGEVMPSMTASLSDVEKTFINLPIEISTYNNKSIEQLKKRHPKNYPTIILLHEIGHAIQKIRDYDIIGKNYNSGSMNLYWPDKPNSTGINPSKFFYGMGMFGKYMAKFYQEMWADMYGAYAFEQIYHTDIFKDIITMRKMVKQDEKQFDPNFFSPYDTYTALEHFYKKLPNIKEKHFENIQFEMNKSILYGMMKRNLKEISNNPKFNEFILFNLNQSYDANYDKYGINNWNNYTLEQKLITSYLYDFLTEIKKFDSAITINFIDINQALAQTNLMKLNIPQNINEQEKKIPVIKNDSFFSNNYDHNKLINKIEQFREKQIDSKKQFKI